jgi:hypothetical protein
MNNRIKLSGRVRPNCEAAPWVIDEIKTLEEEVDSLNKKYDDLMIRAREKSNEVNKQLDESIASTVSQAYEIVDLENAIGEIQSILPDFSYDHDPSAAEKFIKIKTIIETVRKKSLTGGNL